MKIRKKAKIALFGLATVLAATFGINSKVNGQMQQLYVPQNNEVIVQFDPVVERTIEFRKWFGTPRPVLDVKYGTESESFKLGAFVPVDKEKTLLLKSLYVNEPGNEAFALYLNNDMARYGYEKSESDEVFSAIFSSPQKNGKNLYGISRQQLNGTRIGIETTLTTPDKYALAAGIVDTDMGNTYIGAVSRACKEANPSWWLLRIDDPMYEITNGLVEFGTRGTAVVPRAMANTTWNGISEILMEEALGRAKSNRKDAIGQFAYFESPWQWRKSNEYGTFVVSGTSLNTANGYKKDNIGAYYTFENFGDMLLPHVGLLYEKERIPTPRGALTKEGMALEVGGFTVNGDSNSYLGVKVPVSGDAQFSLELKKRF